MASILLSDGLTLVLGDSDPGLGEALEWAARVFTSDGHHAEVIDPRELLDRMHADAPDVLVTDLLPFAEGKELIRILDGQGEQQKTRLVVITSVVAEAAAPLEISRGMGHLIDGFVIRPYCFQMSREERRKYRAYLSFNVQIIATVGLVLAHHGLLGPSPVSTE